MSVKVRQLRTRADGTKVYGLRIDHNGNRMTVTCGSRVAANKAKTVYEYELALSKGGIRLDAPTPSFHEVAAQWLAYIHATKSRGTYTRYSGIVTHCLRQKLSGPIDKINRGTVRDLLLDIYRSGASRSSVELTHTVLSGIFLHALDDDIIDSLPTQHILRRLDLKRARKEIQPFTESELNQILGIIDHRMFFLTAYHTGMRIGELCALQWPDINFSGRYIRVSKTAKDQRIQAHTKTHSVRNVDMSEPLHDELKLWQSRQRKEDFKSGVQTDLVFHVAGKLYSQQTLRRRLQSACKQVGIDRRTVHDIRHTTASILLSRGTPLLYVSKLLGHSSPKMTLDRYSHYMPSENQGMINILTERNRECK